MRKAANTFTTAQGLSPVRIMIVCKLKVDVFPQSYACALSIPVHVCLTGFLPNNKNEMYFVKMEYFGWVSFH
jgi:hypothetical protein